MGCIYFGLSKIHGGISVLWVSGCPDEFLSSFYHFFPFFGFENSTDLLYKIVRSL